MANTKRFELTHKEKIVWNKRTNNLNAFLNGEDVSENEMQSALIMAKRAVKELEKDKDFNEIKAEKQKQRTLRKIYRAARLLRDAGMFKKTDVKGAFNVGYSLEDEHEEAYIFCCDAFTALWIKGSDHFEVSTLCGEVVTAEILER